VNTIFAGGSLGLAWIYLVAPLFGGWVAAVVFRTRNPGD
jgi:glycerol uptake facilitator-like aquaporin